MSAPSKTFSKTFFSEKGAVVNYFNAANQSRKVVQQNVRLILDRK